MEETEAYGLEEGDRSLCLLLECVPYGTNSIGDFSAHPLGSWGIITVRKEIVTVATLCHR